MICISPALLGLGLWPPPEGHWTGFQLHIFSFLLAPKQIRFFWKKLDFSSECMALTLSFSKTCVDSPGPTEKLYKLLDFSTQDLPVFWSLMKKWTNDSGWCCLPIACVFLFLCLTHYVFLQGSVSRNCAFGSFLFLIINS